MNINWTNFSTFRPRPELQDVEFAIACTDREWDYIIAEYHTRWKSWEQCTRGLVQNIGQGLVNGKTYVINIELSFWRINGHIFAIYNGCSMLVHYELLDEFIQKNCPKVNWYSNHSDATNFHNIQRVLDA